MLKHLLLPCLLAAALLAAATPARADNDQVQFGSDIHVAKDAEVHDAVCFFCSVHLEGKATGDIVVFFGNVHLSGDAQHDVVNFFGKVTAEDNATIDHSLVSFFGEIHLGQNVTVGTDLVSMFGVLHAPESVTVGNNRVVQPFWLFLGPIIFLGLIIVLIVREVRAQRRRRILRTYNFPPRP